MVAGVLAAAPQSFGLAHSLDGHTGAVLSLAWTKNGAYVLSASQDKTLRLWNPHTGAHVKTYQGPHNHEVADVVISEDNSKFISCGGDKHFFQWDVSTAQVIRKFVGHDRKVNALAFGPNQDVVLSASNDKTVRIWDLRTRSRGSMQSLAEATDSVLCVAVAGDEIVSGCTDGAIRRYDVRKGQLVVDSLLQPVGSVSFSKDRACMLVSTLDHNIRLLERDTGNILATYSGHVNKRFKVQSTLDPTDSVVISGSEDNRICMWDLVEAKLLCTLTGHAGPVLCASFSGGTLVTAAGDGGVKVWTAEVVPATRAQSMAAALPADSGLPSEFGRSSRRPASALPATPLTRLAAAFQAPASTGPATQAPAAGADVDAAGGDVEGGREGRSRSPPIAKRKDRGRKHRRKSEPET
mmetsp:Transcript_45738/g.122547  ORF Transcript_45738/g.122547 Transcript_45738/m.122547 type:complete len:409 (+) Transcript_45738:66-1292(+)